MNFLPEMIQAQGIYYSIAFQWKLIDAVRVPPISTSSAQVLPYANVTTFLVEILQEQWMQENPNLAH